MIEFQVNKTRRKKKKLMLWVEEDILDRLEHLKPEEITVQECIRQILEGAIGGGSTEEDDIL